MTRSELIKKLADKFSQLTQVDAEMSVKAIIDSISNELSEGGRIEVRGFGIFEVHCRPSRIGRNPMTGERVNVPAKHAPHFRAGKSLKGLLNKKDSLDGHEIQG